MTTATTTTAAKTATAKTTAASKFAADAVKAAKSQPAVREQAQQDAQQTKVKRTGGTAQFEHAGVSVLNGKMRIRFTNNIEQRLKTFKRDGDTEIEMLALPNAMTKLDAVKTMAAHEKFANNKEAQRLFEEYLKKHNAA